MDKEVKKRQSAGAELFGWAQSLIWVLLALILVSSFFVRISGVSGDSMFPTLHNGDRILVQLWGYDSPQRGDIVVIMAPHYDDAPLVKRIIAMEGDTIEVVDGGLVMVNGEEVIESYINEQSFMQGTMSYPFVVPEGCVFVMGDNRNHSADSRSVEIGPLKVDDIIGKAFFRIMPLSGFGGI